MSANTPFDQSGNPYNVSRITSGKHRMFNATAYEDYSPLYLPMSYALSYLLQFALATCLITHTVLYHGKSIVQKVLRPDPRDDDIHAKLMKHYVEGDLLPFFSLTDVYELFNSSHLLVCFLLDVLSFASYSRGQGIEFFAHCMTSND